MIILFALVLLAIFGVAAALFASPGDEEQHSITVSAIVDVDTDPQAQIPKKSARKIANSRRVSISETRTDSPLEDPIRRAIQYGEVLRIRYHGGSQPGTIREIAPTSLKNGLMRATCVLSNSPKNFRIEKVEILQIDETTKPDYVVNQAQKRAG